MEIASLNILVRFYFYDALEIRFDPKYRIPPLFAVFKPSSLVSFIITLNIFENATARSHQDEKICKISIKFEWEREKFFFAVWKE